MQRTDTLVHLLCFLRAQLVHFQGPWGPLIDAAKRAILPEEEEEEKGEEEEESCRVSRSFCSSVLGMLSSYKQLYSSALPSPTGAQN